MTMFVDNKTGIDEVVGVISRAMAAGAVSAKWENVMEELKPLVILGGLREVEGILLKYWPPGVEVDELVAYAAAETGK